MEKVIKVRSGESEDQTKECAREDLNVCSEVPRQTNEIGGI